MAMDDAVAKAFGFTGDSWRRHANPVERLRPVALLYDDMTLSAPGSPPPPH